MSLTIGCFFIRKFQLRSFSLNESDIQIIYRIWLFQAQFISEYKQSPLNSQGLVLLFGVLDFFCLNTSILHCLTVKLAFFKNKGDQ